MILIFLYFLFEGIFNALFDIIPNEYKQNTKQSMEKFLKEQDKYFSLIEKKHFYAEVQENNHRYNSRKWEEISKRLYYIKRY